MELPEDILCEVMLLLDYKSLRRMATVAKRTNNIYVSEHFTKLNNQDINFSKLTDAIQMRIFGDLRFDGYFSHIRDNKYIDDYYIPPRELHDDDKYIYGDVICTKEQLDDELDAYFDNVTVRL